MTVGLASGSANAMLDGQLDTTPTAKVHTGDPGAAGTSNVSVGDASAQAFVWDPAVGGAKSKTAADPVWTNAGTSESLSHLSVYSAAVFKFSAALTGGGAWVGGQTATLTGLTASITPLAA